MIKDPKTTIIGAFTAVACAVTLVVQQGASIEDWKTWILPATLALLGFLSKDSVKPVL